MSIVNGALVVRMTGDRDMGMAMADTLIARDNTKLRAELRDARGELAAYKSVRAAEDDRRLAAIRRRCQRPLKLHERIAQRGAFYLLLAGVALDCLRYGC